MRAYRPFKKIGVLYNAAEKNSMVGVQELKSYALREKFEVIDRTFRRDAAGKPTGQGVADLVMELNAGSRTPQLISLHFEVPEDDARLRLLELGVQPG